MDDFTNRERTLESKYQHDQLIEFKILARRNRLFGLWAAELMAIPTEHTDAYAREVINGAMCTPDGHVVLTKIMKDFQEAGISMPEIRARKQLDYFYQDAAVQILNE